MKQRSPIKQKISESYDFDRTIFFVYLLLWSYSESRKTRDIQETGFSCNLGYKILTVAEEENIYKPEDFSGMKILKQIKKKQPWHTDYHVYGLQQSMES